jgi:hypothetical protein
VYEDGLPAAPADRAGDVRRENPGSYHTNGRTLTLARSVAAIRAATAAATSCVPAEHDPLGLAGAEPRWRGARSRSPSSRCAGACARRAAGFALATGVAVALAGLIVQARRC